MKSGMSSYKMQSSCTWKDMCSQEVEICVFDPSILRGFLLLFSNSNGGLKMATGVQLKGYRDPLNSMDESDERMNACSLRA
jgi:hypothetical protein